MTTYLDSLEAVVRGDLQDPVPATWLRCMDLRDALEEITAARVELAQCPEGARLAFHVLNALQHRLRLPAESAQRHHQGARKGTTVAKAKRQRRAARRHATLQKRAKELSPTLSTAAKARILARSSTLSDRQIRRIIAK